MDLRQISVSSFHGRRFGEALNAPEAAAQRILTDPHSPEQYRTNAPLTNIDAWYTAFNVKPGDKMYKKPEDRTKVW